MVLPAGDRLRAALEGVNSANFQHLTTKHVGSTFRVFGAANPSLPPWKRLQVVAQCHSFVNLDKVEQDVLDLAETACDIVADGLGLTDDQVQQAFEDIRVERSEIKLAPPKASPGLAPGSGGLVAPAMAAQLGIATKARPGLPSAVAAVTVGAELAAAGSKPVAPKKMPASRQVAASAKGKPSSPGQRLAASNSVAAGEVASVVSRRGPTADMPPPDIPPPKKRKKQATVSEAQRPALTAAGKVAGAAARPAAAPAGVMPVTATSKTALPPAPLVPAVVSSPAAAPPASTATSGPAATTQVQQKLPVSPAEVVVDGVGGRDASATSPGTLQDVEIGASSDDSDEEGEEEEDVSSSDEEDADEEVGPAATQSIGSTAAAAGATVAGSSSPATFQPVKVRLSKLGEFCCDVFACFGGGNPAPEMLAAKLSIDQRAKLDRCKEHLDFADDLVTVWRLTATTKRHTEGMGALCDYFISKNRVGMVEVASYTVYMVPSEATFLKALGLEAKGYEQPGCLLAIQVPAEEDVDMPVDPAP